MLSLLFVGIVGCGTAGDSPSEAASIGSIASADGQRTVCPDICGLGTQCQFPDGSCTEACNPCLCRRAGGTVVTSCPASESEQASPPQASARVDHSFDGEGRLR
jgi:hypothetical protein